MIFINNKSRNYVLINIIKMISPQCRNVIKAMLIKDSEFSTLIKCSKVFYFLFES